jgi:tetratricopeptide (TPR) repeat protein
MLSVAPTVYDAKNKMYTKKDEIKANARYIDLPSRDLAPGIVYTPSRAMMDMIPLFADHGFVKEVIDTKTGIIYFKINLYNLDFKFGINKTQPAKDAMTQLNDFVKQGWKIKDITINGWASPDGEETFNAGLSENRAKTANTYMIGQFQDWMKDAEKANKNKKEVKAKVDAAGKDVNFVVQSHGPDWNGFIKTLQASSIKDKDKILNVVNSAGDSKKKEAEIRNMIVIYPEIEEQMLPPLRRAEITADLFEPIKSDDEISKLALSNPDQLKVEALLYAGTLTTNNDTKITIYENAARVYPNNWKANNNAAAANITKGNLDKAGNYLTKASAAAPNTGIVENNIGIVAAKQNDYKKAEVQFKKAQQLGENENYNLGVLAIGKGDYTKANSMLVTSKCSYNLGLAQLVSGNTTAAQGTLECAPQNPDTYYLLAICGARANNTKTLYDNLMKAVVDPKLKEQARTDKEFLNYANSQDFKNIVK